MKYYQTMTTSTRSADEWCLYAGYDKEEALRTCVQYNAICADKDFHAEVREYDTDLPFEDLDGDEQCCVLSCYDTIEE